MLLHGLLFFSTPEHFCMVHLRKPVVGFGRLKVVNACHDHVHSVRRGRAAGQSCRACGLLWSRNPDLSPFPPSRVLFSCIRAGTSVASLRRGCACGSCFDMPTYIMVDQKPGEPGSPPNIPVHLWIKRNQNSGAPGRQQYHPRPAQWTATKKSEYQSMFHESE